MTRRPFIRSSALLLFALIAAPQPGVADDASAPTAAADQLATANELYESGKREEARVWAQKAADQGLADAWFWLAQRTEGGGPISYYEKAAEGGYAEAFPELFEALLLRAGDKADVAKAKHYADLARKRHVEFYDSEKVLETIDRCFEAGSAAIPKHDTPRDEEGKSVRDDPRGNVALAEAYANGWGVKRNGKLALALICRSCEVPAELEDMVETLYDTQDDATLDEPFRFCDHITSGISGGVCAAQEEAKQSKKREGELGSLEKNWTAPQKDAFERLRKAAEAFFDERSGSEIDRSGTARDQMTIDERATLEDAFLQALRDFEAHHYPTDATFARADKELNAVYARLMKPGALDDKGTVNADGVKKTQRLWIRYRDAWTAFAAARYPGFSADAVKTWCTDLRTQQLAELEGPGA